MDLKTIILSKVREKCWMIAFISEIKKKKDKNELTKQTHRLQRQTDGYQRGKVENGIN